MAITYNVVLFGRNKDGDLVPLEPAEARTLDAARGRARVAAAKHGSAIASAGTDPITGELGDAVILATFGQVDHWMLGSYPDHAPRFRSHHYRRCRAG